MEAVVSTYEGRLLAYVTRLMGGSALVEDVVQETFIKLAGNWKGVFEPGPQLSAWLYKVAHNVAVDALRREARRGEVGRRHAAERGEAEPPTTGQGAFDAFDAQRVRDALGLLNERERNLVVLKIYEEKSYQAIAALTGLRVGNVGFILHTAMRKLAAHLGGKGERNDG